MRGVDYGDPLTKTNMEKELLERLKEGRPLKVYLGVDPTSPDLHLGHMVPIQKLKQFQDLGHEVTFLIGDSTGMVGDPSGQSKTRPMLTQEDLRDNAKTYTDQVFKILDRDKTIVKSNSAWLDDLTFAKVIELASKLTVAQLLDRDYFRKRYDKGDPIHLHEFLYCLMQGYDAINLETDVQVGGIDQLFNLLVGRELQRAVGQKPQIALTLPILIGTDGSLKMSKSWGNAIGINEPSDQMYGKVMSIPDEIMINYFTLITNSTLEEIDEVKAGLKSGLLHPRDAKMRLAREIVTIFHGSNAAEPAEGEFIKIFRKKELPTDMKEFSLSPDWQDDDVGIVDLIMETQLVSTRSEVRRLIKQGGIQVDGVKVREFEENFRLEDGMVIRIGKKRFARLRV